MLMVAEHISVLLNESLQLLHVRPGGIYVDCTVGLGGHCEAILSQLEGRGKLIGLDRDGQALEMTRERLQERFENFRLYPENFKSLGRILQSLEIQEIDGCLADLGVSSHQLSSTERGFSFQEDGPLDMRMDQNQKTTAADLINKLPQDRLAEIFFRYGEEKAARKIARIVVEERRSSTFRTTRQLAGLVEQIKGRRFGSRLHPATQVFQALRIEVNQELAGLEEFLHEVIGSLSSGGRFVVISFHSLEDRIVKQAFRKSAGRCVCFQPGELCTCPRVENARILTRKPLVPSDPEVERNPRARSAKLRAVEKT